MRTKKPLTRRESRDALRMWSAFAPDRDKAAASDAELGLDKPERTRVKPVQREAAEQTALMRWAKLAQGKTIYELGLVHV